MSYDEDNLDSFNRKNFKVSEHLTFQNSQQNFLNLRLPEISHSHTNSYIHKLIDPQIMEINKSDIAEYYKYLEGVETIPELGLKPGNETFQSFLEIESKLKVYINIPSTIVTTGNGIYNLLYNHHKTGEIKAKRNIPPKNIEKILGKFFANKSQDNQLQTIPKFIVKQTNQVSSNDGSSTARIFLNYKDAIEYKQKMKSEVIIQQFISTRSKSSSIFRIVIHDKKAKVFLVIPRRISEKLISKFNPDNGKSQTLETNYDDFAEFESNFMKNQYCEKQITKCREGGLRFLEDIAIHVSELFHINYCNPKGFRFNFIILDFIQGKQSFFFLQIKGYSVEKIPLSIKSVKYDPVDTETCKGQFCKEKENSFLSGLIISISKFKEAHKLILHSSTMNYIYSRYKLEIKEASKVENKNLKKYGIFLPLISNTLLYKDISIHKENSNQIGLLYDVIPMCILCHDIFYLYENKLKIEKIASDLLNRQLDYLRNLEIEEWTSKNFDMLVNLLKPSITPHSNAFLSFVKLPFLDDELYIPLGKPSIRKKSPKQKKYEAQNFLQRINIQDQYKLIKINDKYQIQGKTAQNFSNRLSMNNLSSNIKSKVELKEINKCEKDKSIQGLSLIQKNLVLNPNMISIKNQTDIKSKRSASKLEEIREIYLKKERSKFPKNKFKF